MSCHVCGGGRCVCRLMANLPRILPPVRVSGVHPLTPGAPDYGRLKAANAAAAAVVQRPKAAT